MKNVIGKIACVCTVLFITFALGCSPDVGSESWCKQLKEKPKGDWSANEAADFTKYCLLKSGK